MKFSTTSFAAGAVTVLVLGSGTAYAATGGKFILGKSNYAGATSSLTNKNGTALALNSKSGTAPLKVNRTVKVANLNSDLLDGLDSGSFARSSMRTGSFDALATAEDVDGDGAVDAFWAEATCPSGTVMTGGGINDFTATGYTIVNGPMGANTWATIVAIDPSIDSDPTDVVASVTCLNPKGAAPAGSYRAQGTEESLREKAREAARARLAAR